MAPAENTIDREGLRTGVSAETTCGIDGAQRILAVFNDLGLRTTRPRRAIAEYLAGTVANGGDFTAEDLWRNLQHVDPGIGRATVFRAVDLLTAQGVLDRIAFADGSHRYRVCGGSHHHHVTCSHCQRVVEVDLCLPRELLTAAANSTDFTIEGHSLELFGTCAVCRGAGPR